jgi:hypothetical protein
VAQKRGSNAVGVPVEPLTTLKLDVRAHGAVRTSLLLLGLVAHHVCVGVAG